MNVTFFIILQVHGTLLNFFMHHYLHLTDEEIKLLAQDHRVSGGSRAQTEAPQAQSSCFNTLHGFVI